MRNILITTGGILFVGICLALAKLWFGMFYFALVGMIAIMIFWAVRFILKYKEDFYDNFEDGFKIYIAKLVNSSPLTLQDIEKNRDEYKKKYKKSLRISKLKTLAIIFVFVVVAIICFVIMVSGKISK